MQEGKRTQLRIYRPTLEINGVDFEAVWESIQDKGVKRARLMQRVSEDAELAILRPQEVRRIFEQADVPQNEDRVGEFADFLDENLPDSSDSDIEGLPILPIKGDKAFDKANHWLFQMATPNIVACGERIACMALTNQFFGFKGDYSWQLSWSEGLTVTRLNRNGSGDIPKATAVFDEAFEGVEPSITYGPLVIDDYTV